MNSREPLVLLALTAVALVVSGIAPFDRTTWWLEVFPVLLVAPLLVATARRFPLTPLLYRLIFLHALVLILGGHYTYARVPLGRMGAGRVPSRAQPLRPPRPLHAGFVTPAMAAREVLLRTSPLRRGGWLFFLVLCVALAISAAYELVEWAAAVAGGEAAEAFLGTQGDAWDTQWDMFLALLGAATAQLVLGRVHDRQLEKLGV